MPLLSLIESENCHNIDGCRHVNAPGGYEIWKFDAIDVATNARLIVAMQLGSDNNPRYWRDYRTYRASPTRHDPPVPSQYPSLHLQFYLHRKLASEIAEDCAQEQFSASDRGLEVTMGKHFARRSDRSIQIHLRGTNYSADLIFSPIWQIPALELDLLHPSITPVVHRRDVLPPYQVKGAVQMGNSQLKFDGIGFHDHQFGSAPPGDAIGTEFGGWAMGQNKSAVFTVALPRDGSANCTKLIIQTPTSNCDRPVSNPWMQWKHHGLFSRIPSRVSLDDALTLSRPRVVRSTACNIKLIYNADIEGEPAIAQCEINYPPRSLTRWLPRSGSGAHS